jgi:hypothetical protein
MLKWNHSCEEETSLSVSTDESVQAFVKRIMAKDLEEQIQERDFQTETGARRLHTVKLTGRECNLFRGKDRECAGRGWNIWNEQGLPTLLFQKEDIFGCSFVEIHIKLPPPCTQGSPWRPAYTTVALQISVTQCEMKARSSGSDLKVYWFSRLFTILMYLLM